MSEALIRLRPVNNHVIALDCPGDYFDSKPSFLVPEAHGKENSVLVHSGESRSLRTENLLMEAQADPFRIQIYRLDGSEEACCTFREPSSTQATIALDRGFTLYGCGASNSDRSLDRRGRKYRVHHREMGQGNNYMPWVLSSQGFGIFADTSFPLTIDLRDRFCLEGRNIRTYYFINGPSPIEALERFVELTGLPPMHPAWALGYEQSSRTWLGASELDFVTSYFREKGIPCDGLALLSTYSGEGGRGRSGRGIHEGYLDFYQGWNAKGTYMAYNDRLMPEKGADVRKLKGRGFHPIVHGYFLSDYSDPEAVERIWKDHKFLVEDGWDGWWLDGAESVWDAADERRVAHVSQKHIPDFKRLESQELRDEYDNVWALLRAKAFYEKQRRDFPDKRVYILNRTVFPGAQSYAAGVNQGDFWGTWERMRIQVSWLLNMAMSGIVFPESDIGGFYASEELDQELFIRWAFLATFAPIMRSHGHNWRCRLPWGFGPENEARYVPLIRLRYALFPYNYTLLREANQKGIPMMRPMVFEFPDDVEAKDLWDQYMWGASILVAPVMQKGVESRPVYVPEGKWVHYWTNRVYEGPGWTEIEAPLGQDPLLIRAGAVVPMSDPTASISSEPDDHLTLFVLPDEQEGRFTIYDDDRISYEYEEGKFSLQEIAVSAVDSSASFSVTIGEIEGDYRGIRHSRRYSLIVPGTLVSIDNVRVDGTVIPMRSDSEAAREPCWAKVGDCYQIELGDVSGTVIVTFESDSIS